MRWNEEKSRRFQTLREAELRGALTSAESGELEGLLADLDADEVDELGPAIEQAAARVADLGAEKARLDEQVDALTRIAGDQEKLLAEATAYLQKLRDRSAALESV